MSYTLCQIVFFFSMLMAYIYVASTTEVIVLVLGYVVCTFTYNYFDDIKVVFEKIFNNLNISGKFENDQSSYFSDYKVDKGRNNAVNVDIPPANPQIRYTKSFSPSSHLKVSNRQLDDYSSRQESYFSSVNTSHDSNNHLPKNGLELPPLAPGDSFPNQLSLRQRNGYHSVFSPLVVSKRFNSKLDFETIMNVSSPGFTSRVVDKAQESAAFHIKYPAVRQISTYRFNKSILRQISKIPSVNLAAMVRMVPLEQPSVKYVQGEINRNGNSKKFRKNDGKNVITFHHHRRSHNSTESASRTRVDDDDIDRMLWQRMHVSSPNPEWSNRPRKRRSTRLERTGDECYEKLKKYRKVIDYASRKIPFEEEIPGSPGNFTHVVKPRDLHSEPAEMRSVLTDKYDSKIDPVSVIASEPEYANDISKMNGSFTKDHILRNFSGSIDRKSERNENIMIYENSIMKEIIRNGNEKEIVSSSPWLMFHSSSSMNENVSSSSPKNGCHTAEIENRSDNLKQQSTRNDSNLVSRLPPTSCSEITTLNSSQFRTRVHGTDSMDGSTSTIALPNNCNNFPASNKKNLRISNPIFSS